MVATRLARNARLYEDNIGSFTRIGLAENLQRQFAGHFLVKGVWNL